MSKYKGNRTLEATLYGTPMYVFSDTPDGRIVTELHKKRLQDEEHGKKELVLHEATVREIARIREDNLSRGQGEIKTEQIAGVLGNLLDEFKRANMIQGMEAMRADETGKAVKEAAQTLKGPERGEEPLRASLGGGEDLAATLELLGMGALNPKGSEELFRILDEPLREDSRKAATEIDAIKEHMRKNGAGPDDLSALDDAYGSISSVYGTLNNPQKAMAGLKILKGYTMGGSYSGIRSLVSKTSVILSQFKGRRGKPATPELLVKLTNSGFLTDTVANAVMEKYPEARKRASIASMNYSLTDIERETRAGTRHLAGIRRAEESALGQRETMIGQNERREQILSRQFAVQTDIAGAVKKSAHIHEAQLKVQESMERRLGSLDEGIGMLTSNMDEQLELSRNALAELGSLGNGIRTLGSTMEEQLELSEDILEGLEEMGDGIEAIGSALEEQSEVLQGIYDATETANSYLAGIDQKSDLIRYRLEEISETLSQNHEELIDSIDGVGAIVGEFMEEVREQAKYHGEQLFELSEEIILTRVAISTRLKKVGKKLQKEIARQGAYIREGIEEAAEGIKAEIAHGNEILEQLLTLSLDSQINLATQRFNEGQTILTTARGEQDFRDAYDSFLDGIRANRAVAENYFGAGITAESLGMKVEAISYYDRAGRRATDPWQQNIAAKAFEHEARLLYLNGEIGRACEAVKAAVEKDPDNLTTRFMQLKFHLESGDVGDLPGMVVAWAKYDENLLLHLLVEPAYVNAPAETKNMLLEAVWKANVPRNSFVTVSLLEAAMEINSPLCKDIFHRTLLIAPGLLLEKKIWRHPAFEGAKRTLFDGVMRLSSKDLNMVIAQDCALLAVLYAKCDFPRNYLQKVVDRLKKLKAKDDAAFWNTLIGLAGDDPAAREKLRTVIN
jgi:tetratricopeptide (TPR) repeat protein